jgi:hypothetical protein
MEKLHAEFAAWEALLAGHTEAEIVAPQPDDLPINAIVAHLMAWQQLSLARLEAAQQHREPQLPIWLGGRDPEQEENTDDYNAHIQQRYGQQPWPEIYRAWRAGFQQLLALGAAIPAEMLHDAARFPWLNGYALVAVLEGTHEHHAEHRVSLMQLLQGQIDDQRDVI